MHAKFISPQDKQLFNDFVASVPKSHIFQSYEWGELKATTDWEPIRFLVLDGTEIRGALAILKRSLPLPGKCIFYAPRGPVCDIEDYETMDFIWQTARQLAREHGAIFLKIDPDITADRQEFVKYLRSRGFVHYGTGKNFEGIQPRFVFRLKLDKPLEEIMADFKSKTRYNVRYAQRKGVEIVDNCTKADLKQFYEILKVTAERDNFMIRSYEYFENIWDILVENDLAKLFMARFRGEYIAGTLAMKFGNKTWYIYGASANKHRNKMPNYLLQWHMIEWAHKSGCDIYDFRGVSGDLSEDNPLYGLYRFKVGFGGDFTEFIGEYDLVFSKLYYQLWIKALPSVKNFRRKLLALLGR